MGVIRSIGAMGAGALAVLATTAGPAFGGGASVHIAVGATRITVTGNTGGLAGAYGQVFFDTKSCAPYYRESGRREVTGDPLSAGGSGAFHGSWSIAALTSGSPIDKYICAYVVAPDPKGGGMATASAFAAIPQHHKKH